MDRNMDYRAENVLRQDGIPARPGNDAPLSETVRDLIRLRREALRLAPATLDAAGAILANKGWKESDAVSWLHREWFNDLVVYEAQFKVAAMDPDGAFLAWIRKRSEDPYHVTPRAIEHVGNRYGSDVANLFQYMRWPQEIAWARYLREDEDHVTAVMSALFLTDVRRNPGKIFRKLVDVYIETSAEDIGYHRHPNHELSEDEILAGKGTMLNWDPLFLRYARQSFRTLIERFSPGRLAKLARVASQESDRERQRERIARCVEYIARRPLSCRITTLHIAREERMSSNDLVACERAFTEALERGDIPLPDNETTLDTAFFEWMRGGDYRPDNPDAEETRRRIASLALIDRSWMEKLSPDIRDLGATRARLFSSWRADVMTGRRPPPLCLATDYSLYVLEHHD